MCLLMYDHYIVVYELVKTLGDQIKSANSIYIDNRLNKSTFKD